MTRRGWLAGVLVGGLIAGGSLVAMPASAEPALVPLSPSLVGQLLSATSGRIPVMVHGATLVDAERAVAATGMQRVTTFRKIGVVVARGTKQQVTAARTQPGVTYLEGDQPIAVHAVPSAVATHSTSLVATRGLEARQTLVGANGAALDGTGVSIAVIDSGIDPTHPAFAGGKVVRSLKSVCLDESNTDTNCLMDVPTGVDTDTLSLGGHGSHVSSIAAGRSVTLSDGSTVSGAAPAAKIVSLSTGAAVVIVSADSSMNWVLEHHAEPCGAAVPVSQCPPIRVVNNSYGPQGGGEFDPKSATVKLQRQLVKEGVVVVWAAGNDGGDGSKSLTNPPAQDPTGGIISVASYNDQGSGTRSGPVSTFSSRGAKTDPSTWPDISAPGQNIVGACRAYLPICSTGLKPQNGPGILDVGSYNTLSGTSMAAPQIAGIVALLFQADPTAMPVEIEKALKSTALHYSDGAPYQQVGGYWTSFDKGTGLVDTVAAAKALGAHTH
ncbi:MAG: S8 family serine peptidase [Pseudonocardiales bacterium]|nr:S8 family serine peptidase [Pseudonocardiales bacterium]MBV9729494.1 S8 family serine peptidase [Pseudonocardiales bacterium]